MEKLMNELLRVVYVAPFTFIWAGTDSEPQVDVTKAKRDITGASLVSQPALPEENPMEK